LFSTLVLGQAVSCAGAGRRHYPGSDFPRFDDEIAPELGNAGNRERHLDVCQSEIASKEGSAAGLETVVKISRRAFQASQDDSDRRMDDEDGTILRLVGVKPGRQTRRNHSEESSEKAKNLDFIGAGGGTRTRTDLSVQRILSPLCLPLSPPRLPGRFVYV
jgi:hypothetical protein